MSESQLDAVKVRELIREGFYSQAITDAVAMQFHVSTPSPLRFREFLASKHPLLSIGSDTQLALFGQEAIIIHRSNPDSDLICEANRAYLRWFASQTHSKQSGATKGLINSSDLCGSVIPRKDIMTSLRLRSEGKSIPEINCTGPGPATSLLPLIGLFETNTLSTVTAIALEVIQFTHPDDQSRLGVEAYMGLADDLLHGCSSKDLPIPGRKPTEGKVSQWGPLAYLDLAVRMVRSAKRYDQLLELVVSQPGDRPGLASIAGALWGLAGRTGCAKYLPRLQQRAVMQRLLS